MAWLGTWAKRREITVSSTNIDSNLTHFALPIFINATAGTGSKDLTSIFDEVGSNSLKIAITKDDGTTEIYGDIEQWDDTGEKAVVHVSKSDLTLSSSGDTTLYIYYDNSKADNTTYISLSGGTAAQSVWDSNHKAVYHLHETSGTRLDSTSNNNDLTDNNTVGSTTGLVDGAADFEYNNSEYLSKTDNTSLDITGDFSCSAIINIESDTPVDFANIISKFDTGGDERSFTWSIANEDRFYATVSSNGTNAGNEAYIGTDAVMSAGNTYSVGMEWDASASTMYFYLDGVQDTPVTMSNTSMYNSTAPLMVGAYKVSGSAAAFFDGWIDEVRYMSGLRGEDWFKAVYEANNDNIASYGNEEAAPTTGFARSFGIIMG